MRPPATAISGHLWSASDQLLRIVSLVRQMWTLRSLLRQHQPNASPLFAAIRPKNQNIST